MQLGCRLCKVELCNLFVQHRRITGKSVVLFFARRLALLEQVDRFHQRLRTDDCQTVVQLPIGLVLPDGGLLL